MGVRRNTQKFLVLRNPFKFFWRHVFAFFCFFSFFALLQLLSFLNSPSSSYSSSSAVSMISTSLPSFLPLVNSNNTNPPSAILTRKVLNANTQLGRRCLPSSSSSSLTSTSSEDCVHVVVAANGPYLIPLTACLNSILQHTKRVVAFHLLISKDETRLVEELVGELVGERLVEIVEFNVERVQRLIHVWKGLSRHSNALNHARFYLPQLFQTLKTTIYLDPDTITQADIGELWDLFVNQQQQLKLQLTKKGGKGGGDVEDKFFAAVVSKNIDIHSSTYDFLVNCEDEEIRGLVVDPKSKYFNAGVFVTDLERWREEDITGQLEHWMKQNTQRRLWSWGSQAPLSLVFYNKWFWLPYEWNERRTNYRTKEENDSLAPFVKIFHFTGEGKPWKNNGPHLWHMWCKYYPRRDSLWFCREGTYLNLLPSSPTDYSFLRSAFLHSSSVISL